MISSSFVPLGANPFLDLYASGALTQSRPFHPVGSREKPSKRTKEAWAESRAEARIREPAVEAVLEAILEAILEAVEPAVEARVEHPASEARVEPEHGRGPEARHEPASEARHHLAVEARVAPVRDKPVHVLGVTLTGRPQHHQKREGPNAEGQESSKHDRPPLVKARPG